MKTKRSLRAHFSSTLLAALALLGASQPWLARAAIKTWDGSSSGNWNNAANWSGSTLPVAGDDLIFPAGVTRLNVTNDFIASARGWRSITFLGSNYFLFGTNIVITNGISAQNPTGLNTINCDVDLHAPQTIECLGSTATFDINGDISLGTNTLTVSATTGDLFFSGVVSGTGGITKVGVGTLRFDGSSANTYSGVTRVNTGILELDKAFIGIPVNSIVGDLVVGDGVSAPGTDFVRLLLNNQIANSSIVTVNDSGVFDLNDNSDFIGPLIMNGGLVESGTGTLTLQGNIAATSTSDAKALITGHLALGGADRTFGVTAGPFSPDLQIDAIISGTNRIFKTGDGELSFTAANTYSGTTTVLQGSLDVDNSQALGATTAGTTVNNGASLVVRFDSHVGVEPLSISGTGFSTAGALDSRFGSNSWAGDITLTSDSEITVVNAGDFMHLSGAIGGPGGFTKLDAGTLILSGSSPNTFAGTAILNEGTMLLGKGNPGFPAIPGPLVIGDDVGGINADVVRELASFQIDDPSLVTINSSGLLDLNGFQDSIGSLVLNGGDIAIGASGRLSLFTGGVTVNVAASTISTITGGELNLGGTTRTFNVTSNGVFSPELSISAHVIGGGAAGILKTGPGEMTLSASNSYPGVTTVDDGFLILQNDFALGTTNAGTVVNGTAVLTVRSSIDVGLESLTLNSAGQGGLGALYVPSGSNSWAGNIALSVDSLVTVDPTDFLNLSGGISGAHNLTKQGTGTLIFSGSSGTANTYADTFINAGTLVLQKNIANVSIPGDLTIGDGSGGANADVLQYALDNQISDLTAIHIANSGLLDMNDRLDTVGSIDGFGRIDLGSGSLRAGADNGTAIYNGLIVGTGSLFKFGTGTWTLNANNPYAGATTVSAGTLVVNGLQQQSPVTVNGTATLMGSGIVGNLHVFGDLRPGASPGLLTSSNVLFDSLGEYFVELNGPNPGSGYDQLSVRGTNNLGSSTLHVSVGGGFAPFEGEEFVILNNDGAEAIVGTFNGLPNNSLLTANGLQFRIRYSDTFGNDVVLTLTNTAARVANSTLTGGNGNGTVDPNECNFLNVVITNVAGVALNNVTGTLVSKTPGVSVTSGNSAYPNLAVNGRATNSTPFQFSTSSNFVCGTNIQFDLVVKTAANGTFAIPLAIPSGFPGTAIPYSLTLDQAIPDLGTLNSTIAVSGITSAIARVTVSLHLGHTSDADLDISLIGPDGTIIDLSSDNGGTLDDYGLDCGRRTTFDDSAATAITAGTAPFFSTFRPEQALSNFVGKVGSAANGTWTLRITDDTAGGLGTLHCWTLNIAQATCTDGGGACESCPENRTITGVIGNGSAIQAGRLTRNGDVSGCGTNKICPGEFDSSSRQHDAYVFENGESNACITVTLTSPCDVFSAAYLNSYNPTNLCQNYVADPGDSTQLGGTNQYSFKVTARSRFIIVVNEVDTGGCDYALSVTGGSCRPVLKIAPLAGNKVALDWSTAAIGYGLESTNILTGPLHPAWVPVPTVPVITAGRYAVTNSTTGAPPTRFFQLRKP